MRASMESTSSAEDSIERAPVEVEQHHFLRLAPRHALLFLCLVALSALVAIAASSPPTSWGPVTSASASFLGQSGPMLFPVPKEGLKALDASWDVAKRVASQLVTLPAGTQLFPGTAGASQGVQRNPIRRATLQAQKGHALKEHVHLARHDHMAMHAQLARHVQLARNALKVQEGLRQGRLTAVIPTDREGLSMAQLLSEGTEERPRTEISGPSITSSLTSGVPMQSATEESFLEEASRKHSSALLPTGREGLSILPGKYLSPDEDQSGKATEDASRSAQKREVSDAEEVAHWEALALSVAEYVKGSQREADRSRARVAGLALGHGWAGAGEGAGPSHGRKGWGISSMLLYFHGQEREKDRARARGVGAAHASLAEDKIREGEADVVKSHIRMGGEGERGRAFSVRQYMRGVQREMERGRARGAGGAHDHEASRGKEQPRVLATRPRPESSRSGRGEPHEPLLPAAREELSMIKFLARGRESATVASESAPLWLGTQEEASSQQLAAAAANQPGKLQLIGQEGGIELPAPRKLHEEEHRSIPGRS